MLISPDSNLSLLIFETDAEVQNSLLNFVRSKQYEAEAFSSFDQILLNLDKRSAQIVMCSLDLLQDDSFKKISAIKQRDPQVQIIVVSSIVSIDIALTALRNGANDIVAKPVDYEQLTLALLRSEQHLSVINENKELKEEVEHNFSFAGIISHNQEMKQVFETVKRLSTFNSTVLITGESGTGKELIARAIHNNSLRRAKPFVAVNCGAIPESLIESELFGHKKGAFTDAVKDRRGLLEEASSGTLFLDEIGEMPALLQVKLLRAIQEKNIRPVGDEKSIDIDTRIIAATNRNLEADIKSGQFREDLFYRLNVVSLNLPSLRRRKEDIPFLCEFFIEKFKQRLKLPDKKLSSSTLAKLCEYDWPGNIRELENCLERALLLSKSNKLEIVDLPEQLRSFDPQGSALGGSTLGAFSSESLSIKLHAENLEIRLIKEALMRTSGNRTHAARLLEISHRALLYKLKDYQLSDFLKE